MPIHAKIRKQDVLTCKVLEGLEWNRKNRELFDFGPHDSTNTLVRRLRGSTCAGAYQTADRLNFCSLGGPCGSGACSYCISRMQAWFAQGACAALWAKGGEFRRLTLIPPKQSNGLDIQAWQRSFCRMLREAGITFGFGGIDVSWNEDHRKVPEQKKFEPHWSVHLWLVGLSEEIEAAEKVWRKEKRFAKCRTVPKPIHTLPFTDNCEANLLYALKPNFYQRNSITVPEKNGRKEHRGTRERPLRIAQDIELAIALDRAGIKARLLIFGAQIHHGPDGSKISLRKTT